MKKTGKLVGYLISICVLSALLLVGCGGGASTEKKAEKAAYPTKPITLIVPFAAGGGTDTGARLMAAELEKILKVPFAVVNKAGASGWLGWSELVSSKPDGYTIGHFNDIDVISGYLDSKQNRKNTIDDFTPIYCYVSDPQVLAINVNEKRFTNIKELIEYAKKNEVTVAIPGNPSFISMTKINKQLGTKFLPVRNKGAAEGLPAVMGGHVDVMLNTVGETRVPANGNQIKPVAVLAAEKSKFLPNVPTFKEAMGVDITSSSVRGFAAPKGLDPAVLKVLIDAFEKGAATETFKTKMADQGLGTISVSGDAYKKLLKEEEASVKELVPLLGW